MNPESVFIKTAGLRTHVSRWGDPSKPPVVLLHGMRDQSRTWDWLAHDLARDHCVIAPDLRGHGDTEWAGPGSYSLSSYILDLEDVAAAFGLARFPLVGHSFGGAISLRYTSAFPDKVLGLFGIECIELPLLREHRAEPKPHPVRLREWIDEERRRRLRQPRAYSDLAEAEERMRAENPDLTDETVRHLARHAAIVDSVGGWRWKYDYAARLRAPDDADGRDLDEMLEAIACPVTMAYGTCSWVPIPPTERLNRIRNLQLVQFPGHSHWLHHTARNSFIKAVRAFLSDLPKGSSNA